MNIKTLEMTDTGHKRICAGFGISDIASFAELILARDKIANDSPGNVVLLSLDCLGQSLYTSMHATNQHDLDDTTDHDLSGLDPRAFDAQGHLGYLSTTSEFFIREANFKAKTSDTTFTQVCARGLTIDDDELTTLEKFHAAPALVLDDDVVAWVVPVSDPSLALCVHPNGYFTPDLTPFENHALAAHLHTQYGYRLFGVGASCIGFEREAPLDNQRVNALAADISRLYNCTEDEGKSERIRQLVQTHNYLFLKYVEYLET